MKGNKFVIESLQRASVSLFGWFENNLSKGNADKCHFIVSTSQEVSLNVNTFKLKTATVKNFWASDLIPNLGLINILQIYVEQLAEKYTH